MSDKKTIRAERSHWGRCVSLLITQGDSVVVEMTLKKHNPALVAEPSLEIDTTAAQSLMDDLWECGIRPTEGSGSAGALAATERHLADMQRLVFKNK
jgi:hypothetical protein